MTEPGPAELPGGPQPHASVVRRNVGLSRLSELGASAQAAIPGLYAWAITVAPAAWSRGTPLFAKAAAVAGVVALITAPVVEGAGLRFAPAPGTPGGRVWEARAGARNDSGPTSARGRASLREWMGPTSARTFSVWGFVVSSAIVWTMVPGALSSARFDGVRGTLGVVGWALFAFASAGPSLRVDSDAAARIVSRSLLKPRSEVARGDGAYLAAGVLLALAMQGVGWAVLAPERAVLVRLVTVACGVATLGATTSIALARHVRQSPAPRGLRLRRALPSLVILALIVGSGIVVTLAR